MRTRSWLCFSNLLCLVFCKVQEGAADKNGWIQNRLHLGDKSIESEEVLRIVDMEEQRRLGSKSKAHEILGSSGEDYGLINGKLDEEESTTEEEIDEENRSRETINLINRKIGNVNNNLRKELNQLGGLQKNLHREVDLQKLLDRMIKLQREKLRSLIKVKENHMNKAATVSESINKLRQILISTNSKKIDYLDELSDAVQREKTKDQDFMQALDIDDDDAVNTIEEDIDNTESTTETSDEENKS